MKPSHFLSLVLACLASVLAGCPAEGVLCRPGTTACNDVCVDTLSDAVHCGACGVTCGDEQTCQEGTCACREGASVCAGACTVLATDVTNCGECGNACPGSEVCEQGNCQATCSTGFTLCGSACVELQSDVAHCGACNAGCLDVQTCRAGACTYDAIAACYSSGHVVGLRANGQRGALRDVANHPVSLGRIGQTVLVADDDDTRLRQLALPDLAPLAGENATGGFPTYQVTDGNRLYVTAQAAHALLIFEHTGMAADAGTSPLPPGIELVPATAAIPFGDNTFPNNAVRVGDTIYIALQGALFGDASAGQKVARVDVSVSPPVILDPPYDLSGLDLKPFEGANPLPFPQAGVAKGGFLYFGLTSADPATFGPGGPGMIVKIDPTKAPGATGAVSTIELGADCTNSGFLAVVGDRLVVSCAGSFGTSEGSGVALIGADDAVKSKLTVSSFNPGRLAVSGNLVLVGNNAGGDALLLRVSGDDLVALRGANATEGPVAVCPVPDMSFASVTDLLSLP